MPSQSVGRHGLLGRRLGGGAARSARRIPKFSGSRMSRLGRADARIEGVIRRAGNRPGQSPTRPFRSAFSCLSVGVLAACSGGGGTSSRPAATLPVSTTADATTTTLVASDGAVLAAYHAFWAAYLQASNPMDPLAPVLAAHATGSELSTVAKAFLAYKDAGDVIRGTFDLDPKVVSIDGPNAVVRDCYGDNTHLYSSTGAQVDTSSGTRHLVSVDLQLGGTWRVSQITHLADGCTAP